MIHWYKMANFQKLKGIYHIGECDIQDVQMQYGHQINNKFVGIQYCHVDFAEKMAIMNIIPREYHKCFYMTIMRINTQIPPHTDSGIKSTINFYINTDNCKTQFYKFKNDNPKKEQIENQSDGYIFDSNDLEETDFFVAQPSEAWVLNVANPHSVIPQSQFKERLAIALSSELEYDMVCDILKEEKYL